MQAAKTVTTVTPIILTNWAQATEEFHGYYSQINSTISKLQRNQHKPGLEVYTKEKLRGLLKLRQHMVDVLSTLLANVDRPQPALSKPGQLICHTRLIQDMNHKIKNEMMRLTGAQA
jgi:hypothetical protein